MSVDERKLRDYKDLIEIIAKVEYQKFSSSHLIELPELVNIGTHALYILFKNNPPEKYNNTYLSTAIKWAIRNEVRRRYKWYTLKNKKQDDVPVDDSDNPNTDCDNDPVEIRAEVYKNILSIDELQDGEVPTQIKSDTRSPEEDVVYTELKTGILEALQKLPPREKEFIECKFIKDKKLREIALEYNISQSRISRIIQSGLDRIKKDLAKQGII